MQVQDESITNSADKKNEIKDEHVYSTLIREGNTCKWECNVHSQEMYNRAENAGAAQNVHGDKCANEQCGREVQQIEKQADKDAEKEPWYMNEPFPMIAYRVMFTPNLLCQYYNFKKCEYCHRVFPANRL